MTYRPVIIVAALLAGAFAERAIEGAVWIIAVWAVLLGWGA